MCRCDNCKRPLREERMSAQAKEEADIKENNPKGKVKGNGRVREGCKGRSSVSVRTSKTSVKVRLR